MQRRVAYVHSDELVRASSLLPSNKGRSSLVHTLHSSLALVATGHDDHDDDDAVHRSKARIVPPVEATRSDLLRFHDPRYIGSSSHSSRPLPPTSSRTRRADLDRARRCHPGQRRGSVSAWGLLARPDKAELALADGSSAVSSNGDDDGDNDDESSSASPLECRTFGLASDADDRPRKRQKTDALGLHDDCPVFDGLADYVKLVAGASMTAARELRDGRADVVINWTGGRHHGKRGEAAGFCYVNDIVLAIIELRSAPRVARSPTPPLSPDGPASTSPSSPPPPPVAAPRPPRISRVLYLDLDLHHGDGVESAFLTSPYVLTLSLHLHAPLFYPSTGALDSTGPREPRAKGAHHALNVPLEPGAGEETLRRLWTSCMERIREAYDPDAVVLQLGTDGLAGDPCKVGSRAVSLSLSRASEGSGS